MTIIDQLRQKPWATIFVIYLRYLIGGAFVFSSIVKIQGLRFTSADGASAPLDSAWHFFEILYRSGLYWNFLGWSQLLAGLLLMTQRFAAIGALVFFPIILNIFVITVSYSFKGTPVITGLMLLANIFLLLWDYQKFMPLIGMGGTETHTGFETISAKPLWGYLGLSLFLTTVIGITLLGRNPLIWFAVCILLGFGGLIVHFTKSK